MRASLRDVELDHDYMEECIKNWIKIVGMGWYRSRKKSNSMAQLNLN